MGLFDKFRKSVADLYIARPDAAASQLVWLYPERNIPNGAKLTVRSDETAVFFRQGRHAGTLSAGTYTIDTAVIPFLNELLIASLTGGNHYVCELFFVREAEYIHRTERRELGTYTDLDSRQVASIEYSARFGVRVTDPLALITQLGGQRVGSARQVAEFLDARTKSLIQATVGQILAEQSVLAVVSNQYNEQIGRLVHNQACAEFAEQGLILTRFLDLEFDLDDDSEDALKEFGRARSLLSIDREGAEIAGDFATWKIAQGQQKALEGFGLGMAKGGASATIVGGFGLGQLPRPTPGIRPSGAYRTPMVPGLRRTPRTLVSPHPVQPTAATMRWFLRSDSGELGPYTMRQLVRRAVVDGLDLDSAWVRGEHDPEAFPATTEQALVREFARTTASMQRVTGETAAADTDAAHRQFEAVFRVALSDSVLTGDELAMLMPLALRARIAVDEVEARQVIEQRARAYGCRVEAASLGEDAPRPPPPPRRPATAPAQQQEQFDYYDGENTMRRQTAGDVAHRVAAAPDGYHVVWVRPLDQWMNPTEVPAIATELEKLDSVGSRG